MSREGHEHRWEMWGSYGDLRCSVQNCTAVVFRNDDIIWKNENSSLKYNLPTREYNVPTKEEGNMSDSTVHINNIQGVSLPMPYLPRKNAWTTFWLCGFFGFLGVHRFYLGHMGLGLLYLFTAGLFGVGALVDLFLSWEITRKENLRRGWGLVTR